MTDEIQYFYCRCRMGMLTEDKWRIHARKPTLEWITATEGFVLGDSFPRPDLPSFRGHEKKHDMRVLRHENRVQSRFLFTGETTVSCQGLAFMRSAFGTQDLARGKRWTLQDPSSRATSIVRPNSATCGEYGKFLGLVAELLEEHPWAYLVEN